MWNANAKIFLTTTKFSLDQYAPVIKRFLKCQLCVLYCFPLIRKVHNSKIAKMSASHSWSRSRLCWFYIILVIPFLWVEKWLNFCLPCIPDQKKECKNSNFDKVFLLNFHGGFVDYSREKRTCIGIKKFLLFFFEKVCSKSTCNKSWKLWHIRLYVKVWDIWTFYQQIFIGMVTRDTGCFAR
jgi:hypothetical protein